MSFVVWILFGAFGVVLTIVTVVEVDRLNSNLR